MLDYPCASLPGGFKTKNHSTPIIFPNMGMISNHYVDYKRNFNKVIYSARIGSVTGFE